MPHANPEIRRQYMRKWRELHAAEIKAEKIAYRKANRQRMNAQDRARYLRNCGRSPTDETDYRWKISPGQINGIIERYLNRESCAEIGKTLGVAHQTIRLHLIDQGVEIRNRHESRRKLFCNNAAFDEITDASAYWAGFLITDGCIHRNSVIVNVGVKDREHLEQFRSFLKADAEVKIHAQPERRGFVHSKGQIATLSVNSRRLCAALAKLGITPRKTFTAKASEQLIDNRHFWRGVIDGDGTICMARRRRSYPMISLCGASPDLLNQFSNYCGKLLNRHVHIGSRHNGRFFVVQIGGTFAVKVIENLYSESVDHLERKKVIAVEAANHTFKPNGGRHSLAGYKRVSV